MKNKTLTENVRNMFIERFDKLGINYEGLKIGNFTEVGLECRIPTLLVFENIPRDPNIYEEVISALFDIVDILGISDEYDSAFDFLLVTSQTDAFNDKVDMEEF